MNNEGYYQKYSNRTRMEFDGRGPRLRLSLIGYCIEQGIVPDKEQIETLVDYVAADLDGYCEMVETLPVVEEEESDTIEGPRRNGYDVLGGQYM